MSQLYARIFVQILDSSIAEDFTTRHIFEDLLKLCDRRGIVDMTRHAISRRLNVPVDVINACIEKLEKEDPSSRDQEFSGRRIERLDAHRDWGWKILNWEKYDSIRTRADSIDRVTRHRQSAASFDPAASMLAVSNQPEVVAAWESWVKHRRQKRAALTEETAKKQLANLQAWGDARFIAAINHSITNGWTGMFEPAAQRSPDGRPPQPSEHHIWRGGKWQDRRRIGPNLG